MPGEVGVSRRLGVPLYSVDRRVGAIETWLNYAGVIFIIFLMLVVVAEVVSRYVFKHPIQGYIDVMEMMMVALVFFTLAYTQWVGGHIRMELFINRVLKEGRLYHVIEFFHLLACLLCFALIAVYSVKCAVDAYVFGDVTMSVFLPIWPARLSLAIGTILLCVRFAIQMFQHLKLAVVGAKRSAQ